MSGEEILRIVTGHGTIRIPLLWACEQFAKAQANKPEHVMHWIQLARAEPDLMFVWLLGQSVEWVRPVASLEPAEPGLPEPILSEAWDAIRDPSQVKTAWA